MAHWRHAAAFLAAGPLTRVREPLIRDILLVGGGGLIGSVLRYACGTFIAALTGPASGPASVPGRFPAGTLFVNVLGCFVIGVLGAAGQHGSPWSNGARLFLFTGVLGGFTTFSAFGYETFELARTGNAHVALLNVLAQLLFGMMAVAMGHWIGMQVAMMLER